MNDPLLGQQLANFRIERVLGRGGMAQVYYGMDVKLQRPVAIKVIDARYRDKPDYARRFVNEARVLAKWRHEHIVQIYYADDEDGLYYYAMEYIDGQNLGSIIESYAMDGELMPVEDVLHIGGAVAEALDYAHQQGVVHRDIKPSNILVARDGRVVLGDFGLAMDRQDVSMGEIFGTPHYISPEQASRSANAVPQSDIYSLGVILYEILVGVVPFNDPSPTSLALQHITVPPPAPQSINPYLSVEVEKVLLKTLEKSPQDRFQTGAELIAALTTALKDQTAATRPPLPPIPAGVPTIARRPFSKESVTQRVAAAPAASYAALANPEDAKRENKGFSFFWLLISSLLFLGAVGLAWAQGWLQLEVFPKGLPFQPALATAVVLNATNSPVVTLASSPSANPGQATSLHGVAYTATLIPEGTATPQPPPAASYTPAPTNTVQATQTVNPDWHLFRLYYDENSLYLLNLSRVTRSISGFSFERVGKQGERLNFFGGWDWGVYYSKITPNRCTAIELYESPPFLKPPECRGPYLSLINPRREARTNFWTSSEGGQEFRVRWLFEEVARCPVGAGMCEFRIP